MKAAGALLFAATLMIAPPAVGHDAKAVHGGRIVDAGTSHHLELVVERDRVPIVTGINLSNVLLAAVDPPIAQDYLDICVKAGLNVTAITVSSIAAMHAAATNASAMTRLTWACPPCRTRRRSRRTGSTCPVRAESRRPGSG